MRYSHVLLHRVMHDLGTYYWNHSWLQMFYGRLSDPMGVWISGHVMLAVEHRYPSTCAYGRRLQTCSDRRIF